jgi:hypothetical protein
MSGSCFELEIQGVRARISAERAAAEPVAARLTSDLSFAAAAGAPGSSRPPLPPPGSMAIELRLHGIPFFRPLREQGLRLFRTRMAVAHGWGPRRVCDYGNGSVVVGEADPEQGVRELDVYSPDPEVAYELAWMALMSAIGEELDACGWHRAHAIAWKPAPGSGAVLALLPQGGGKSAIAALLTREGGITVYSDEMPLLKSSGEGVEARAFPLRMALEAPVADSLGMAGDARVFRRLKFPPKRLYPIAPADVAGPAIVRTVLLGRTGADSPSIVPLHPLRGFVELAWNLTLGLGLPQMSEHLLRVDALPRLVRIAWSRFKLAWKLSRTARVLRLQVSRDARRNAEFLRAEALG